MPANPDQNGVIVVVRRPDRDVSVGVWLMPDNQLPGRLETFAAFLIPDTDALWLYAKTTVSALPEQRFHEIARDKANIHTWLAWQEKPGILLGQAISARYLDKDAPHAQKLTAWIRNLFE